VLALRPGWYTANRAPASPLGFPVGDVYGASDYVLWGATALLAARAPLDADTVLQRKRLALVGVAFGILAGHTGGQWFTNLATPGPDKLPWYAAGLGLAALAVATPRLVDAFENRNRRLVAGALALSLLLGTYRNAAGWLTRTGVALPRPNLRPFALTLFAFVLGLAVVRFGLAGVRRNAGDVLARCTGFALAIKGIGALAATGLEAFGLGPVGFAVVAATLIVPAGLALTRARRVPQRIADWVTLDPENPDVLREWIRIHEAALDEARDRDATDERTHELLAELRAELGLTERDHELLIAKRDDEESDDREIWLGHYHVDREIEAGANGRV